MDVKQHRLLYWVLLRVVTSVLSLLLSGALPYTTAMLYWTATFPFSPVEGVVAFTASGSVVIEVNQSA